MRPATTSSYTGTRDDILRLVPATAVDVLDVGCADGSLGAALVARRPATAVTGVELDPGFAETARGRLDRVLQGDAAEGVETLAHEGASFDAIVCADILEHLPDPESVLGGLTGMLRPEGAFVVSLPNVRYYETFVQLAVRGRWPRRDRGVHDRTHLRWFTDADARAMFASAGLSVQDEIVHHRLRDRPGHPLNRHADRVARGPVEPFLAYQLVYLLRPVGAAVPA